MITGEEVSNYIRDHSVLSYNLEKEKLEQMISAEDAWKLVLMVTHNICSQITTILEPNEETKVQSNAESGTLSESNRSSEKDA